MIRKLQRKFITTNMLLVSLVLLAVFCAQTFSAYQRSYQLVRHVQLQALEWITHSLSPSFVFDRIPPEPHPQERRDQGFPSVPTFAVEIDDDHHVIALRTGPGVEVTQETAQAAVDEALAQAHHQEGVLREQKLSYLYCLDGTRQFLAFADNSSIGSTVWNQVRTSVLICAAALLAFFLISWFLAKLSLRPVERAWDQQRQFVADASHELKTPITVILANTSILLSHPQDPVQLQRKWIDYIQDEAGRMKALVDDLLFLAKSDAQRLPLHPTLVRLDQLVTGSLLPFESVAFERSVTLSDQIAPDLTIEGDETQLRRLVVILLDNAVKYAGEHGTVTVTLDAPQGRPCLSVHNTGPAIPPEHLPHLFERFYRADSARDRTQGGYGLGLAIAKSIVEAHTARISVTSSPQAGTTFTVSFPKK